MLIFIPRLEKLSKSMDMLTSLAFRPAVLKLGGKLQFPFLVDPNNDVKMYESAKIVEYLWSEYGAVASPFVLDALASLPVLNLGVFLASGIRMLPRHGLLRTPSINPEKNWYYIRWNHPLIVGLFGKLCGVRTALRS